MGKDAEQDKQITELMIKVTELNSNLDNANEKFVSVSDCERTKGKQRLETMVQITELKKSLERKFDDKTREIMKAIDKISPVPSWRQKVTYSGVGGGGMLGLVIAVVVTLNKLGII